MEDAAAGKAAAKAELRARMGLGSADVPLVAVVTRLTHQKGIHLIKHAAWRTLERGAQFVLLGSAPDPRVQVPALTVIPSVSLSTTLKLGIVPQRSHVCRMAGQGHTKECPLRLSACR